MVTGMLFSLIDIALLLLLLLLLLLRHGLRLVQLALGCGQGGREGVSVGGGWEREVQVGGGGQEAVSAGPAAAAGSGQAVPGCGSRAPACWVQAAVWGTSWFDPDGRKSEEEGGNGRGGMVVNR